MSDKTENKNKSNTEFETVGNFCGIDNFLNT